MTTRLAEAYQELELAPGATLDEVKRAYRDLAQIWHPDRFAHNERLQRRAQDKLTAINVAYEQVVSHLQARTGPPATPPHAAEDASGPVRARPPAGVTRNVSLLAVIGQVFAVLSLLFVLALRWYLTHPGDTPPPVRALDPGHPAQSPPPRLTPFRRQPPAR